MGRAYHFAALVQDGVSVRELPSTREQPEHLRLEGEGDPGTNQPQEPRRPLSVHAARATARDVPRGAPLDRVAEA